MLQRNLIYTAITRSKSKLILLGQLSAFDQAVKNAGTARKTYLVERFGPDLTEAAPEEQPQASQTNQPEENLTYILTEANLLTIDPMIGLTEEDIQTIFNTEK